MKKIIECGECTKDMMVKKEVLKTGNGAFGREYRLIKVSEGYEVAGSAMRHTKGYYACISSFPNGTTHGQRYRKYTDALEHFERCTTPIVEVSK